MKKLFSRFNLILFTLLFLFGCGGMTFNDLVRKGNLVKVQQKVEDKSPKIVQFEDDDKVTPLHVAATWGYLDIAKFLIEKGAKVNAVDLWNKTPLFRAVEKERVEIAKLLIEKGADPSIKDARGKTALDMAKELKNEKMIALLEGVKK